MINIILTCASIISALSVISGVVIFIVKWVSLQNKKNKELDKLHAQHNTDIQDVKCELYELSNAMLAALDGLIQQGCNGNVTLAHKNLSEHLNAQAHNINKR